MPVRSAEAASQPSADRQNEAVSVRKNRLGGGASRVPVQTKAAADSPFRTLVTAIGQSLGSKTPSATKSSSSRKTSAAAAKASAPSSSAGRQGTTSLSAVVKSTPVGQSKIPSTPAPSRIPSTPGSSRIPSALGPSRIPSSPPNASRVPSTPTLSRVSSTPASYRHPFTPASSRLQNANPKTPVRRSSLSSSSSSSASVSSSGLAKKQSGSSSNKGSAGTSSGRILEPKTPVSKPSSMPPKTPKAETNPITPSSNMSSLPNPTPRRPAGSSTTLRPKPTSVRTRSKSVLPTTPVSKHSTAPPTTPVHAADAGCSTPHGNGGLTTFYTPNSTLPLTPLQPRDFNVPESFRKLHFGIDAEAMADQENLVTKTPKSSGAEPTFAFDRSRLAQIKARRNNESEVLKSPAQRIRVPVSHHPPSRTPGKTLLQTPGSRGLQQVDEDRSARFEDDAFAPSWVQTPARRRVANSLF